MNWLAAAPDVLACEFVVAGAASLRWQRKVGRRIAPLIALSSLFAAIAATRLEALTAAGIAGCGFLGGLVALASRLFQRPGGN